MSDTHSKIETSLTDKADEPFIKKERREKRKFDSMSDFSDKIPVNEEKMEAIRRIWSRFPSARGCLTQISNAILGDGIEIAEETCIFKGKLFEAYQNFVNIDQKPVLEWLLLDTILYGFCIVALEPHPIFGYQIKRIEPSMVRIRFKANAMNEYQFYYERRRRNVESFMEKDDHHDNDREILTFHPNPPNPMTGDIESIFASLLTNAEFLRFQEYVEACVRAQVSEPRVFAIQRTDKNNGIDQKALGSSTVESYDELPLPPTSVSSVDPKNDPEIQVLREREGEHAINPTTGIRSIKPGIIHFKDTDIVPLQLPPESKSLASYIKIFGMLIHEALGFPPVSTLTAQDRTISGSNDKSADTLRKTTTKHWADFLKRLFKQCYYKMYQADQDKKFKDVEITFPKMMDPDEALELYKSGIITHKAFITIMARVTGFPKEWFPTPKLKPPEVEYEEKDSSQKKTTK